MKALNVKQGSDEWHAERAKRFTASEAAAMMGCGYISRDELLRQKSTGIVPEVTPQLQILFDAGHKAEKDARPIMEKNELIGEDLYPVTAVHDELDFLLASFDGVPLMEDVVWEHKLWNEGLAERVRNEDLEPKHYWQLEQQLLVSGADKAVFTVSDGTKEKMESMEYTPVRGRAKKLLAGWAQFKEDLDNYTLPDAKVEVVAAGVDSLPAIAVNVSGSLTVRSNLDKFEKSAMAFIGDIKTELETDQDFSDAKAVVKFCDKTERELDIVKQNMLAQVSDIDEAGRMLDRIKSGLRTRRLSLDKQVKVQEQAVRDNVVLAAKQTFSEHLANLQQRIGTSVQMPSIAADFAGAIKGKRTIETLRSAANDELARAKIEASEVADKIDGNFKALEELAKNYGFLFSDIQQIILKDREDLINLANIRINEHKAAEQKKIDDALVAKQKEDDAEELRLEEAAKQKLLDDAKVDDAPEEGEKATEQAESEPEQAKRPVGKVFSMLPSKTVHTEQPAKTMMQEIATWADAYRIPQEAVNELVLIIEAHAPEAASK